MRLTIVSGNKSLSVALHQTSILSQNSSTMRHVEVILTDIKKIILEKKTTTKTLKVQIATFLCFE